MIELQGTLKERLDKAIELVSTEVTEEEIENFKNIYEKANIKLSQAAIDFYKKYGGVYRNKYVFLNDPTFNKEFCLNCYVPPLDYYYKEKFNNNENIFRDLEDAMEYIDDIKVFANQEVCPIARIGYYYPAEVYIGENGLLYCSYEFQEEIETFNTPSEILEQYLKNNIPIGVDEMPIKTKY